MVSQTTFYFIILIMSLLTILSILYIHQANSTIYATFGLILVFLSSAFLLLLLGIEFLALIYISIYVGAISVFFVFVVMIFDLRVTNSFIFFNKKDKFFLSWLFFSFFFLTFQKLIKEVFFNEFYYSDMTILKYLERTMDREDFIRLKHSDLRGYIDLIRQKQYKKTLSSSEKIELDSLEHQIKSNYFYSESTADSKILSILEQWKYESLTDIGIALYNINFLNVVLISILLVCTMVGAIKMAVLAANYSKK